MQGRGEIFAGERTTRDRTQERHRAVWQLPDQNGRRKLVKTFKDVNEASQSPVPKNVSVRQTDD